MPTGGSDAGKAVVLAVILLAACAPVAGCGDLFGRAIGIGVIAELTGDIPAVGASCRNAAELAAAEVNAAGGLNLGGRKHKIRLYVEDNAGSAERSSAAAHRLIAQKNVVAIVGPNASRYAVPASDAAEAARVVLITPWSTTPSTTRDGKTGAAKRYVFRACFTDPFQGKVVARFAREELKARRAAVLFDAASEYNKGIAEIFKGSFEENGGRVVAFETYATNDRDFAPQLLAIRRAAPDVLFLPNYYSEVPLQVRQARRLGIKAPIIGSDSWGSGELLKLAGADVEGCSFTTHYAADAATPAATRFIQAYRARYGAIPDDVAALTYDAFGLLFLALETAGRADREAVRDAMARIPRYEGVTGTMHFKDGSGDPIKSAVILRIRDGKFAWFANVNP